MEEKTKDEEDFKEKEPLVKYQRIGKSFQKIIANDFASALCVHSKIIAIGTYSGAIFVFDFHGNQLNSFKSHHKRVTDIHIVSNGELIASSSDDGMVIIKSLETESLDIVSINYQSPVYALQLEEGYAIKREKTFASGGISGHLYLNKKGWLIQKDTTLHEGEGPVHCIRWYNYLLAWANDWGVKVYDTEKEQRVTFVERPVNCPPLELCRCHLVWENQSILIIGWGDCIKVVKIQESNNAKEGKVVSSSKYGTIISIFHLEFFISGLCIWNRECLAVLAYYPPEVEDIEINSSHVDDGEGGDIANIPYPELHILSREDGHALAVDALPLKGYEHLKASDYRLESTYVVNNTHLPPIIYILAPKDLVIARVRDIDDHITWELEAKNYEKALDIAIQNSQQLHHHDIKEIVNKYLSYMFSQGRYKDAAARCPELLKDSETQWEYWVWVFAQKGHLADIAPFVPTENPRINSTQYDMVLKYYLENDPKELLATIRKWPKASPSLHNTRNELNENLDENKLEKPLYNAEAWINRLENLLRHRNNSSTEKIAHNYLLEVLAELYTTTEQFEHALRIYLSQGSFCADKNHIFTLILRHNLWKSIQDKVLPLMDIDKENAVKMLVSEMDHIPVASVISQLAGRKDLQLHYLHNLFSRRMIDYNMEIYAEFHDLQTSLYAELKPSGLLQFLKLSNFVPLEKAHSYCMAQNPPLWDAMIYVLQRMGNHRDALDVIVTEMKDVKEAINFVQSSGDDELWDYLIEKSVENPAFVGELLDQVSTCRINPHKLLSKIVTSMEIPGLKTKLIQIISDYKLQLALCEGCSKMFSQDSIDLLHKLVSFRRKALYIEESYQCTICCEELKTIEGQIEGKIALFSCGHAYHKKCLISTIEDKNHEEFDCFQCGNGSFNDIKFLSLKKLREARIVVSQRLSQTESITN